MAEMTGAGDTSPKPRSLAMALRTDVPPPAPEITPVMSMPACLKKSLSIATANAAPEGSALYWAIRACPANPHPSRPRLRGREGWGLFAKKDMLNQRDRAG